MNICDNLKLVSYVAAADAFDKSKNIFYGFLPMVESIIVLFLDKYSISFLFLQQKINETYQVNIPKETLRYLIDILVEQKKVRFISRKTIIPIKENITTISYEANENNRNAIEDLFLEFQGYLIEKGHQVSLAEVRDNICSWVYLHSYDLADFIENEPNLSHSSQLTSLTNEWKYSSDLIFFLIQSKKNNKEYFRSFVRLFDGAVQTTLLNFTPKIIKEVSDSEFKIKNALLDTNFILRLLELQSELDNETAITTWNELSSSGTKFYILSQTIQEASSSIKGFLNEISPYTQQAKEFIGNRQIRTSGFLNAMQNGMTKTDFFELTKENNLRELLESNFDITIIDDFDDPNLTQDNISSLILFKNKESYDDNLARHDLLLISYCRKQRKHKMNTIIDAQWWVITNDAKLASWNRKNNPNIQECLTETQLTNLTWLQSKKDGSDGLTNTIVILSSRCALNTSDLSTFAKRIDVYKTRNIKSPQKLDSLALVFESSILTTDDIKKINTQEDELQNIINTRVAEIKIKRQQQFLELKEVKSKNNEMSAFIKNLTNDLEYQKIINQRNTINNDINDINNKIKTYEELLNQLYSIKKFCEGSKVSAARNILLKISLFLILIIFIAFYNFYPLLLDFIKNNNNWFAWLNMFISSGIIISIIFPLYYFIIVFFCGTPYKPAELFCELRDRRVLKKKCKYISNNKFKPEYNDINLDFEISNIESLLKSQKSSLQLLKEKLDYLEKQIEEKQIEILV